MLMERVGLILLKCRQMNNRGIIHRLRGLLRLATVAAFVWKSAQSASSMDYLFGLNMFWPYANPYKIRGYASKYWKVSKEFQNPGDRSFTRVLERSTQDCLLNKHLSRLDQSSRKESTFLNHFKIRRSDVIRGKFFHE